MNHKNRCRLLRLNGKYFMDQSASCGVHSDAGWLIIPRELSLRKKIPAEQSQKWERIPNCLRVET